jgi:Gram-negative bacterial TonB protein C-terminal
LERFVQFTGQRGCICTTPVGAGTGCSLAWKGSVIFDRKSTVEGLFEAKSLLDTAARAEVKVRALKPPARQPEFLTAPDFFRTSWWSRLGTLLSRYPAHLTLISNKLFRDVPIRPRRFAAKQLAISAVLHACAFLLLPFVLRYFPFQVTQAANIPLGDPPVIYYTLANPERHLKAPTIRPPGPGSTPGSGTAPELPPVPGATASHAALFAVSHPKTPDNDHQTILQPLTQPDLKMKADLKLPNLFLSKPQAPKATLQFNPNSVKPLQRATHEVTTVAPTLTTNNVQQPLTDALLATNQNPRLAVPIGAPPAPNMPSRENGGSANVGAPEFETNGSPGQGLLILGVNPGTAADMVALPPGNRYGQFSIEPGGNGSGAPGGQPGGSPNGGTGGGAGGGNESTGVGSGKTGGGGGDSGTPGVISVRGNGGTGESLGTLAPEHVASMVFAMPKISGPRHAALMVAAGPMGGGGLDVYGALHCGKIYTVFLPAAGKGWTLQFCQSPVPGAAEPPAPRAYANVVHMEQALVPPEAETRFDFKRTPLPFEKLHKYVILKGRIDEEGKVADLKVHRGLSNEMDAAAKLAFSQWTFKPAVKAGKPVSIDILVGIPSDPPKGAAAN